MSQDSNIGSPTVNPKVALYSFHPFTDSEFAAVAKACEEDASSPYNGANKDFVATAPKPHFLNSDAKVENVIAYHRDMVKSSTDGTASYDPNYFIIVKTPEWKRRAYWWSP
ncbi:hypothetical protein D9758_012865 [Tetrapyrgos nigripes]|uniref:Uncharacterized protein n=1 Tax=Tetrapyrgos nigripes TaxID=182062 RepID=A0A8H5CCG8_9AGAR|nr:hypothetical protein D9758_012865 [Tetrapyrgos nigripes]